MAQGGEETLAVLGDDVNGVGGFADVQMDVVTVALAASIERYEETLASALHTEGYLAVVAQNDGTHVQTVWGNGSEADC